MVEEAPRTLNSVSNDYNLGGRQGSKRANSSASKGCNPGRRQFKAARKPTAV